MNWLKYILLFLILNQNRVFAQLNQQYRICSNCNSTSTTYGSPKTFTISDVTSDFGARRYNTYNWHGGVDYVVSGSNNAGNAILALEDGFVKNINNSASGLKDITIEGSTFNYGYRHIFKDGSVSSTGMESGAFVLKKVDNANRYAIINLNTSVAIGRNSMDMVTYNGMTYPVQNAIVAGQAIAPIGGSGGFSVHLHVQGIDDITIMNNIALYDDTNANNPLDFINHINPGYSLSFLKSNCLNPPTTNLGFNITYGQCSGRPHSPIIVKAQMNGTANTPSSTYTNGVFNIETVYLQIKEDNGVANYSMIAGSHRDAIISYGGVYHSDDTVAPNTLEDTKGSCCTTGIDPYAYDDTGDGYPWDKFYFTEFIPRIKNSDTYGDGVTSLAKANEEARYPDGKYYIRAVLEDVNGVGYDTEEPILIDNFRPYITTVFVHSAIDIVDCDGRDWNMGSGKFENPACFFSGPAYHGDDIRIEIHTSEPMSELSFKVNSSLPIPCISVGTEGKVWEVKFIPNDVRLTPGTIDLGIEGKDLAFNSLAGNPEYITPVRDGLGYFPHGITSEDDKFSFELLSGNNPGCQPDQYEPNNSSINSSTNFNPFFSTNTTLHDVAVGPHTIPMPVTICDGDEDFYQFKADHKGTAIFELSLPFGEDYKMQIRRKIGVFWTAINSPSKVKVQGNVLHLYRNSSNWLTPKNYTINISGADVDDYSTSPYQLTATWLPDCASSGNRLLTSVSIDEGEQIDYCQGQTTTLNASGGGTNGYQWYSNENFTCVTSNCSSIEIMPGASTVYTVISPQGNCCSIDSIIVNYVTNCVVTCSIPTNLNTTNITDVSASLNWVDVSGAPYTLRYRESGNSWTMVPSAPNPSTLTGLDCGKLYEWQVRAECSSSNSSFYTVPASFQTTACGSAGGGAGGSNCAPDHDEPCGAIEVDVHQTCTFFYDELTDCMGLYNIYVPACDAPAHQTDAWYWFIVPPKGKITIRSNAITLPSKDIGMGIYDFTGNCATPVEVACIRNNDFAPKFNYMPDTVSLDLLNIPGHIIQPGDTLYLRVWEYKSAGSSPSYGAFRFCIAEDPGCVSPPIKFDNLDTRLATEFLCSNNLIDPQLDSLKIVNSPICLGEAAILAFNALYYLTDLNNLALPSDKYPVPFRNLQLDDGHITTYDTPARALHYLTYDDYEPGLPRNGYYFDSIRGVPYGLAIRILLETFNAPPSAGSSGGLFIGEIYERWINHAISLGVIKDIASFQPQSAITYEDFYVFLFRIMTGHGLNTHITFPEPEPSDYYIPGNYTPKAMPYHLGTRDGVFSYTGDVPFSVPGKGLSLTFSFSYSSAETDLPIEFFRHPEDATRYNFQPLGKGWTHNYNARIIRNEVEGETHFAIIWPGNEVNIYDSTNNRFLAPSVYDSVFFLPGNVIRIKDKSRIEHYFSLIPNHNIFRLDSIRDKYQNTLALTHNPVFPWQLMRVTDQSKTRANELEFTYMANKLSRVSHNGFNWYVSFTVSNDSLISYTDIEEGEHKFEYEPSPDQWPYLLTQITLPKTNSIYVTYLKNKLMNVRRKNGLLNTGITYDWQAHYLNGIPEEYTSCRLTTPANITSEYIKDLGRVQRFTSPTNDLVVNEYGNGNNRMLPKEWIHNQITYTRTYDPRGNPELSRKENGIFIETTSSWNPDNTLASFVDAQSNPPYTFDYDNNGGLTSVSVPGIAKPYKISRNSNGQVDTVKSPEQIKTLMEYENLTGYITDISRLGIPGQNITTTFNPDDIGRTDVLTDPNGEATEFFYNKSLPDYSENAYGCVLNYDFNANYSLKTITNTKSETTNLDYTFDEDWSSGENFGTSSTSVAYHNDGLPKSITKGGISKQFSYDHTTRQLKSSPGHTYDYDSRFNLDEIVSTDYSITLDITYDDLNRISDVECTMPGQQSSLKVAYDYYRANLKKIYYGGRNSPEKVIKYEYNTQNRCTTVLEGSRVLVKYGYYEDGRLKWEEFGDKDVKTYYTYDDVGRLKKIWTRKNGKTICYNEFTIDKAGYHTKEKFSIPERDAATPKLTHTIDTYGTSPFNQTKYCTHNNDTDSIKFDNSGNCTKIGDLSFRWDFNDRLSEVLFKNQTKVSYAYDGLGHRRIREYNNVSEFPNLDRVISNVDIKNGNLISEVFEHSIGGLDTAYYVHSPNGLVCRLIGNATEYYHYDYRGSVIATTNQDGDITHAFRYEIDGAITHRVRQNYDDDYPFTQNYVARWGVQREAFELYLMGARYMYRPLGKFISEDPLWASNLYAYANNNPVDFIDPGGSRAKSPRNQYSGRRGGWWRDRNIRRGLNSSIFDERGRELFNRWLHGKQGLVSAKDGVWGEYLQKNDVLRDQIIEQLNADALNRQNSGEVDISFHAEIENGYFTGYQLLHGTDADVGDFRIVGDALLQENHVSYDVLLEWNDIINPSPSYRSDLLLSNFFHFFYNPQDYEVQFQWNDSFTID